MTRSFFAVALMSLMGGSVAAAAPSSGKLSFFACHKEFKAAKDNGTLNGQDYAAFKAAHCSDNTASSSNPSSATPSKSSAPSTSSSQATSKPVASGSAVFPTRIDPEFSSLPAGKARQKTCLKQYHANKDRGGNGNLKWIQKGGGYYSECNNRLKSASVQ